MEEFLAFLEQYRVDDILSVVLLSVVCLLLTKLFLTIFDKCIKRSSVDPLVRKLLRVAIKVVLLFTSVIIVLSRLGISVSSLVATLSVVGVAISLAIQGFLSNVFGGIQIISNRPFQIGDYVEAGEESGVVKEVGLFYTKLDTADKKLVQIPNSIVANASITNYSSATTRRVEMEVSVSYEDDVEKVKSTLLQLLLDHPLVLKEPEPAVHVKAYGDHAISYTARAWCANSDYWTVYFDVMDAIQPTFREAGITMTYPHLNVHMAEK
jgi:small conductance mechanosensitive channel